MMRACNQMDHFEHIRTCHEQRRLMRQMVMQEARAKLGMYHIGPGATTIRNCNRIYGFGPLLL